MNVHRMVSPLSWCTAVPATRENARKINKMWCLFTDGVVLIIYYGASCLSSSPSRLCSLTVKSRSRKQEKSDKILRNNFWAGNRSWRRPFGVFFWISTLTLAENRVHHRQK